MNQNRARKEAARLRFFARPPIPARQSGFSSALLRGAGKFLDWPSGNAVFRREKNISRRSDLADAAGTWADMIENTPWQVHGVSPSPLNNNTADRSKRAR